MAIQDTLYAIIGDTNQLLSLLSIIDANGVNIGTDTPLALTPDQVNAITAEYSAVIADLEIQLAALPASSALAVDGKIVTNVAPVEAAAPAAVAPDAPAV